MSYRSELAIHAATNADRETATGHLIQSAIDAAITETLADLRERLGNADKALTNLEQSTPGGAFERKVRLAGKIEGIRLAVSYINESLRTATPTDAEETR